jgi:hypothetical protein
MKLVIINKFNNNLTQFMRIISKLKFWSINLKIVFEN